MGKPVKVELFKKARIHNSSGPSTEFGKQNSSRNAIKHGIFSEVAILPGEPREKYQSLLKELHETLQSEGRLEELLVEKLASLAWRQRRLLAAEGAEIREGSELREWDKQDREMQEAANPSRALDLGWSIFSDPGLIFRTHEPETLSTCVELLNKLREEIESGAFIKERDTTVLEKIYGKSTEGRKTLHQTYLVWLDTAEKPEENRESGECSSFQQCKDKVLAEIDMEIRRLRDYQQRQASIESERAKLEVIRHGVPELARLDRLLRYEASLERAFDRALNQLERMQRLRRGQPMVPRIEVDVSA